MHRFITNWWQRKRSGDLRVIICGNHSPDWMEALAPDAPVWERIHPTQKLLVELASENDIPPVKEDENRSVVIPLMEVHTAACLRNCPEEYALLVPDEQALEIFRDKGRFAAYAELHELTHLCPRSYPHIEKAHFPCVLKRTDLNGGVGVSIVTSPSHLQELLQQDLWKERSVIVQEFIPGQHEYVAHCVCRNGKVLWHCVYEYELNSANLIRSDLRTTKRTAMGRAQFRQIERFLRPLKYTGPCNVDFKYSVDGNVLIFEINPRLGGSLMCPENIGDLQSALTCILDAAQPRKS